MPILRTDLAEEAVARVGRKNGWTESEKETLDGMTVVRTEIKNRTAAEEMEKPMGKYVTVEMEKGWQNSRNSVVRGAKVLGGELKKFIPAGEILVIGLGNRQITADSVGPCVAENLIVTRHLKNDMPGIYEKLRPVCVMAPGVMGVTGIETAEIIKGVAEKVKPDGVVVVDSLAASDAERLCRSFQITDTGISPGSGVKNSRAEISSKTIGVPVIAVGVPTVADIETVCRGENTSVSRMGLLAVPGNLDRMINQSAKLIGYGINLGLHEKLGFDEMIQYIF